eukprot:CAMPEP_0202458060 /NCGR_PEP_ID=MMETSP1360-20130828/20848_1 /ASSEMBLY_ACC=CAM_ASM_000848 /TAXON_ID=515479 /ORGANISM="Licmophora paradoxa, Strain CCMP2313" /LENGTH=263 /DNA_ID=CAMNT_0049078395 /DNA_START=357 /DNA_END=1149 /DNA_ORIENTATION=-
MINQKHETPEHRTPLMDGIWDQHWNRTDANKPAIHLFSRTIKAISLKLMKSARLKQTSSMRNQKRMPQQQPTPQPTTPDNNLPKPQPPMKVPLVEEEQQGDTISPLRVPEENPKTNLLPTILTQESTTKSSNQMKEKEADTKEALITFQNTTRPAARNKRKRKVKSNKKKQQQPKTILQTIAHVAYHSNTFNPDTRQIAQYFELSRCSEGHLWVESCEDEFGRLMDGNGEKIKQGRNNEIHPRTQYPTRKIRNTSTNCDSFLP